MHNSKGWGGGGGGCTELGFKCLDIKELNSVFPRGMSASVIYKILEKVGITVFQGHRFTYGRTKSQRSSGICLLT